MKTMKNKIEEIKSEWFHGHESKLAEYEDHQILTWANPDRSDYTCQYILKGNKLFISGDVGEAVFVFTSHISLEYFRHINVPYFISKLTTSSRRTHDYDTDKIESAIRRWELELLYEGVEIDRDKMRAMLMAAVQCSSAREWEFVFNTEYLDFAMALDEDIAEWIYTAGDTTSYSMIAYLVGLQEAHKQLGEKETLTWDND